MALEFYINDRQVKVETNAALTELLDKSLDSGSIVLEISNEKNPITPKSTFKAKDTTTNDVWCFLVINDNVEIVRKNRTMLYKHNLSLKQDTYRMIDRWVRNSVFSQPLKTGYISNLIAYGYLMVHKTSGGTFVNDTELKYPAKSYSPFIPSFKSTRTYISAREKVANAEIEISTELTAYTELQTTTKILNVHPRTPQANKHGQNYLRVYFYLNEDDPDDQYEDYIDVQVKSGQTLVTIPGDFFNTNGKGWYALSFSDGFYFQTLASNDISFAYNGGTIVVGTDYPTIQVTFNAQLLMNVYYYSLYDVLETLRAQTLKTLNGTARQPAPYEMPSRATGKGQILDSVAAPEFNFNGKDVFSCVAEVLDYIDALPTLKEDGTLDFEYINDNSGTKVTTDLMDEQSYHTVENYTNRVVSNYQNGRQVTAISYPGKNLWKKSTSNQYGIATAESMYIETDKPIDYIRHLYIKIPNGSYDIELATEIITISGSQYTDVNFARETLTKVDIAPAVIESELYDLLDTTTKEDSTLNKMNALTYNRESTEINLGGVTDDKDGTQYEKYKYAVIYSLGLQYGITGVTFAYGITGSLPSVYDVQYNVEYYAIYNGITTQESTTPKAEAETYVGQTSGRLSIERTTDYLSGVLAMMGNERKSVVIPLRTYDARIHKGYIIDLGDNNRWIVNSVKTTFSTSDQCIINEVELVKNFNNKSQFTGIENEYKMYEINQKLTAKGYEFVNEFIYISTLEHPELVQTIALKNDAIDTIIGGTLTNSTQKAVDFAIIQTTDKSKETTTAETFIPIHTYGGGNVLNFEMGYESPILAGNYLTKEDNKYLIKSAQYVDSSGFADKIEINVGRYSSGTTEIDQYPKVPGGFSEETLIELEYEYLKKPNEILHLNYGVAFLPYAANTTDTYGCTRNLVEEIYLGDKFLNQNSIIPGNQYSEQTRTLYLYTSDDPNDLYSINDKKALGTLRGVATITYDPSTRRIRVTKGAYQCKSWCIADSGKNIYIAVNQNVSAGAPYLDLYFIPRKNRV